MTTKWWKWIYKQHEEDGLEEDKREEEFFGEIKDGTKRKSIKKRYGKRKRSSEE